MKLFHKCPKCECKPKDNKMVEIEVDLSDELICKLQEVAIKENKTFNEVANEAIKKAVEKQTIF